jgi:hypothetical protein
MLSAQTGNRSIITPGITTDQLKTTQDTPNNNSLQTQQEHHQDNTRNRQRQEKVTHGRHLLELYRTRPPHKGS